MPKFNDMAEAIKAQTLDEVIHEEAFTAFTACVRSIVAKNQDKPIDTVYSTLAITAGEVFNMTLAALVGAYTIKGATWEQAEKLVKEMHMQFIEEQRVKEFASAKQRLVRLTMMKEAVRGEEEQVH
jgi:chorismate mutase